MNLTQRSFVQNGYDFDAFESFLIVESNCVHVLAVTLWLWLWLCTKTLSFWWMRKWPNLKKKKKKKKRGKKII